MIHLFLEDDCRTTVIGQQDPAGGAPSSAPEFGRFAAASHRLLYTISDQRNGGARSPAGDHRKCRSFFISQSSSNRAGRAARVVPMKYICQPSASAASPPPATNILRPKAAKADSNAYCVAE